MISVNYDDGFNIFPFHKCYIAVQELLVLFFCFFIFFISLLLVSLFMVCVCVLYHFSMKILLLSGTNGLHDPYMLLFLEMNHAVYFVQIKC